MVNLMQLGRRICWIFACAKSKYISGHCTPLHHSHLIYEVFMSSISESTLGVPTRKYSADFFDKSKNLAQQFLQKHKNHADWLGVRLISELTQSRIFRNEKPDGNKWTSEIGVLLEVLVNGQIGYGCTSDLSSEGLDHCLKKTIETTTIASKWKLFPFDQNVRPPSKGFYRSQRTIDFDSVSTAEISALLVEANRAMKISPLIVQTHAEAIITQTNSFYLTTNGAEIDQDFSLVSTNCIATAQDGKEPQRRSTNGPVARCSQGGFELLKKLPFLDRCEQSAKEAVELLTAPDCPNQTMDLIVMPDQMYLQIHESIGHPLEIDRILGDERNYAGWSFVKLEDFGKLQYGSKIMNVTFDPTVQGEFASYAFDDGGAPATKQFLIKDGVLLRGLGGLESQTRSRISGVSNFRTATWNRAPIDRMANINLEPGDTPLESMIGQVENGIIMYSNNSWSIDDYRDKFQFGCEYSREIKNGKLGKVFKNPSYRGRTIQFWNSLKATGNANSIEVYGSPYCGKGEPNQVIRVGHASPPCLFSNIEVFGGGK